MEEYVIIRNEDYEKYGRISCLMQDHYVRQGQSFGPFEQAKIYNNYTQACKQARKLKYGGPKVKSLEELGLINDMEAIPLNESSESYLQNPLF